MGVIIGLVNLTVDPNSVDQTSIDIVRMTPVDIVLSLENMSHVYLSFMHLAVRIALCLLTEGNIVGLSAMD